MSTVYWYIELEITVSIEDYYHGSQRDKGMVDDRQRQKKLERQSTTLES